MRLCMRLCVNNRTANEAVYEQQCYACEINESSKGKMERCNRTMMTKKEQRKKIVTRGEFS